MKNFKFLSALALTGMLTTGIVGSSFASARQTEMIGEFKPNTLKNISDKTTVPFLLTDYTDTLTVDEIISQGKYSNIKLNGNQTPGNATVKTGDYYTVDGSNDQKHVVVYGDVDKDGNVDIDDVTYASRMSVGLEPDATNLQKEAADSKNDGNIDIDDVTRLARFGVGLEEYAVDPVPQAEQTPEEKGDFKVTPVDQYVNNMNVKNFKTTLDMKPLEEAKTAAIYLVKDGVIQEPAVMKNFTIPAYTSKMSLADMNLIGKVDTVDGEYTFRLVEMSGNTKVGTLAEFTVEAHTKALTGLSLVGVKGQRPSSSAGSVSFAIKGEDKVVKAYYKFVERTAGPTKKSTAPALNEVYSNSSKDTYFTVNENRVDDAPVAGLAEEKAYDVYFVLEDEYGNVDDEVRTKSALIPWEKADETTVAPTIINATITDVATVDAVNEVELKWELEEGEELGSNKFTVVLYKDGKAIAEKKGITALSTTLDQFDPTNKAPLEAGTYHFEVYGEGSGKVLPSATFTSNKTTVTKLNAVNADSIKFDVDKYNKSVLSWDASTSPAGDVKDYKIDVNAYNPSTKAYDTSASIGGSPTTETKLENLGIAENTLYKANVTTEAKGDKLSIVNSDESISKEFFKVCKPGTPVAGSNSVTLKISSREVSGITPSSYKVKVFLYNTDDPDGLFDGRLKEDASLAQDVTVASDGTFEVKGLKPETKYVVRLYATVNGIEGVSEYSEPVTTKLEIPTITEKKVVSGTTTKAGEIAKTTNGISVDGKEYKTADYPAELAEIKAIVDTLVNGDVFTYTSDAITLKLGALATSTDGRSRNLLATLGNRDLYIENGSYSQTVNGTVGGNVIISGNNESLDITGLTSKKEIKINAGSTIKGAKEVVVVANEGASPVNFMDKKLKVNVSTDTTMDLTKPVEITATPSNNITLNSTSTAALNVVVNGDGTDTNTQSGKLDITATGNVTVTAESLAFSADITANVTNGTVDLSGTNLSGAQNVTITNTTTGAKTVKVKAAEAAPFEITRAIDIKEHNVNEYDTLKTAIPAFVNATNNDEKAANIAKLNEYLSKFTTLYGTTYAGATKYGAQITKATGNVVTISLKKTADDRGNQVAVDIDGLQK